jgi:predicted GTPase
MRVLNHRTKPKMFKKKISTCDLFILDMISAATSGTLDEVEQVVKQVKDMH